MRNGEITEEAIQEKIDEASKILEEIYRETWFSGCRSGNYQICLNEESAKIYKIVSPNKFDTSNETIFYYDCQDTLSYSEAGVVDFYKSQNRKNNWEDLTKEQQDLFAKIWLEERDSDFILQYAKADLEEIESNIRARLEYTLF